MTGIFDNFSFPVIRADDRDPDVSWQNHLNRGSSGGVDLAYPYGSAVHANADGVVTNVSWFGTGGHTVRLRLGNGNEIEYMHLSSFSVANGGSVSVGEQVGVSGASGNNNLNFYAPHLHAHMYIGSARVNIFDYFYRNSRANYDMINILCTSTGPLGMVGTGQRFVQGAEGPLRCLADGEWGLHESSGAVPLSRTGRQIEELVAKVGLYEYVYNGSYAGGVGRLTGRILYGTTAALKIYPPVTVA